MRIVFKFDSIFKRLKSDLLIIFSFFIVLRRKTTEDYSLYIKNDLLILRFFWKKREVIFFWNFKWRPQRTPVRHLFPSRGKGGKPSPLGEHFSIIRYELQEERAQRIWFKISHSVLHEIQVSSFVWRDSNQDLIREICVANYIDIAIKLMTRSFEEFTPLIRFPSMNLNHRLQPMRESIWKNKTKSQEFRKV